MTFVLMGVHRTKSDERSIPLHLRQLAVAFAPRFLDAAFPAAERTGYGRTGIQDEPRVFLAVATRLETMQFAIGNNRSVVIESLSEE